MLPSRGLHLALRNTAGVTSFFGWAARGYGGRRRNLAGTYVAAMSAEGSTHRLASLFKSPSSSFSVLCYTTLWRPRRLNTSLSMAMGARVSSSNIQATSLLLRVRGTGKVSRVVMNLA